MTRDSACQRTMARVLNAPSKGSKNSAAMASDRARLLSTNSGEDPQSELRVVLT